MRIHTANITKGDASAKVIKGEFEIIDSKLSFTCHTANVTFNEVLSSLTMMRDELSRQINEQEKCPFHPKNEAKK